MKWENTMIRNKLIFLSILLTSCGELETNMSGSVTNTKPKFISQVSKNMDAIDAPKEIKHHVAEFLYMCDDSNRAVLCNNNIKLLKSIKFIDKTENNTIGTCWKCTNGTRKITIRKDVADNNSMFMKSLVYHELGHCVLDLNHKNGKYIMSPYIIDSEYYGIEWHSMVKDFIEQVPKQQYMLDDVSDQSELLIAGQDNPCSQ